MKIFTVIGCILFLILTSTAFAEDYVMFNYQGRVKVQGQLFDGPGQFKFAIVNNAGNATLWSNDMTSENGNEPTDNITVQVDEGIFNVTIGDPALGMEAINRSVFNNPNQIKLRTWFSDGTHGFQQLLPDKKLHNVDLMGMVSGEEDFTIYVNGDIGSDDNNGLTTETAKKTIQAAVDALPVRLKCSVTIDIADGVYREWVNMNGISIAFGKSLIILGDETWTGGSGGSPAVRITGIDDDVAGTKIRNYGFSIRDVTGLVIDGIQFDGAISTGCIAYNVNMTLYDCLSTNNNYGYMVSTNSRTTYYRCIASSNDHIGFHSSYNTSTSYKSCQANNNGLCGAYFNDYASGRFYESGDFSGNGTYGIFIVHLSRGFFADGYSGIIHDNQYGLRVRYNSYTEDHYKNDFLNNSISDVSNDTGSDLWI